MVKTELTDGTEPMVKTEPTDWTELVKTEPGRSQW